MCRLFDAEGGGRRGGAAAQLPWCVVVLFQLGQQHRTLYTYIRCRRARSDGPRRTCPPPYPLWLSNAPRSVSMAPSRDTVMMSIYLLHGIQRQRHDLPSISCRRKASWPGRHDWRECPQHKPGCRPATWAAIAGSIAGWHRHRFPGCGRHKHSALSQYLGNVLQLPQMPLALRQQAAG